MDEVVTDNGILRYICPHCNLWTEVPVKDVNCKIFRHAVYAKNRKPINPHASKAEVESIKDQIIGCGGPHRLVHTGGRWMVEKCSWST